MTQSEQEKKDMNKDGSSASALTIRHYLMFFIYNSTAFNKSSSFEDYARRWIKREVDQDPELESLSDWVRTIRSLVQGRIHKLKNW
jgi:hypothetical protein